MNLGYDELDWRGLSPRLWSRFALPEGGGFHHTASGNPAFGFFDDFLGFGGTSLDQGYYIIGTGTGTVLPFDTDYDSSSAAQKLATGLGIARFLATADDDEALIAWGASASEAAFKLDSSVGYGDLVFECRILSDILLTNDWAWFAGLIEGGGQATVSCFTNAQAPASTHDQLGFLKLLAGTTAVDSYCKNQATADQGLAAIHTNVASEYVKLGFRWDSAKNVVKFYVDGVEQTSHQLNVATITAALADSFPDDNYMTPIICVVTDQATDMTAKLDWWACAQALG